MVIKVEHARRPEDSFKQEVECQKEASKAGFVCPIILNEVATYSLQLYGMESSTKKKFYSTVMPRLGLCLEDRLQSLLFVDTESVQKLTAQMLMGMRSIHETGFTHSDIKPANIMFDVRQQQGKNHV